MFYLIQENTFKEVHYNLLIDIMQRHKFDYEIMKVIPFEGEVNKVINRNDIWIWGTYDMIEATRKYNWKPGSMNNANHDIEVYGKYYDLLNPLNPEYLLNFTDPLPEEAIEFFARPTKDTKCFSGQIFTAEKWNTWVRECIANETAGIISAETRIQIAPIKDMIQQEVRCWVVGGKVITASRYKLGRTVSLFNYDDETDFIEFAQSQVDRFQVADAFVIDVCKANGEYKVVEVNCINAAGFYLANMTKLITAIENHF